MVIAEVEDPAGDSPDIAALYLGRKEQLPAEIIYSNNRTEQMALDVELLLAHWPAHGEEPESFEIRRIALSSDAHPDLGYTGLAIVGPMDTSRHPVEDRGETSFQARMYYTRLTEDPENVRSDQDATYPQFVEFTVQYDWQLERLEPDEMAQFSMTLVLEEPKDIPGNVVQAVKFDIDDILLQALESSTGVAVEAASFDATPLSPCLTNPVFADGNFSQARLAIRFVSIAADLQNISDAPTAARELVDGVCRVWWHKGGIRVDPDLAAGAIAITSGSHNGGVIDSNTLANTLITDVIPDAAKPSAQAITIYLVDSLDITDDAGRHFDTGVTKLSGTNDAYIIIAIPHAIHNRYLLAHEIGHVWGIEDPGPTPTTDMGDYSTVMLPNNPNSQRNTLHNLERMPTGGPSAAANTLTEPIFELEEPKISFKEDPTQGFHQVIRDFPYDDGTSEADLELPFNNWWDHSDIWNASTTANPVFAEDYTPPHDSPWSSGANIFFARVHAYRPLLGGPTIFVHGYLANPGLSSAPLHPLNGNMPFRFDGSDFTHLLPMPAKAAYQHTSWTVPPGYPPSACFFAIARRIEPPSGGSELTAGLTSDNPTLDKVAKNPTSKTFADLFTEIKINNDVAQRNLNIQAGSAGALTINLPRVHLSVPDILELENAIVRLHIVRTGLPEGMQCFVRIGQDMNQPGSVLDASGIVELTNDLHDDQDTLIRLTLKAAAPLEAGDVFRIEMGFDVGGEIRAGYTHLVQVMDSDEAAARAADQVYAAARDVAFVTKTDDPAMRTALHDLASAINPRSEMPLTADVYHGLAEALRHMQTLLEEDDTRTAAVRTALHDLAPAINPRSAAPLTADVYHGLAESLRHMQTLLEDDTRTATVRNCLPPLIDGLSETADIMDPEQIEHIRDLADHVQADVGKIILDDIRNGGS